MMKMIWVRNGDVYQWVCHPLIYLIGPVPLVRCRYTVYVSVTSTKQPVLDTVATEDLSQSGFIDRDGTICHNIMTMLKLDKLYTLKQAKTVAMFHFKVQSQPKLRNLL